MWAGGVVFVAVGSAAPPDEAGEAKAPAGVVIVEGQVTDQIGAGQADVRVTVRLRSAGQGDLVGIALTDTLGDFAVRAVSRIQGDVVVTFNKPEFATLTRELHVGAEEFPPYLAEQLEGDLVVTGRVMNAATQSPVPKAAVTLKALEQDWHVKTDEGGRFTLKNVTPGQGELVVEAEGFGRERQRVTDVADLGEAVVELKPERVIHLQVADEQGTAVAGVTIESYDKTHDDFRTAVTDKQGTSTLRGVHFDTPGFAIRLSHEAFVSSEGFDRDIALPEKETESTHKCILERAGRITGRVTEATTGDPLGGARVITGTRYATSSPRGWADYKGGYTVSGVRPGETVVTVHRSGNAPALQTVDVTAGETATLDIRLGRSATIIGTVKASGDEPVGGAEVVATRWRGYGTLGLRALTDADGGFVIEDAPRDGFELTVSARGAGSVSATVNGADGAPVELVLPGKLAPQAAMVGGGIKVGDAAPALSLVTLAGATLRSADLAGKTVLVDFWATWCGPCVADLPFLVKTYERFGARKDFVMIGVSLDDDEDALRRFVKKRKLGWHQVVGDKGGAKAAADAYGVVGIPALFLIGPDGKIAEVDLHGAQLPEKVQRVLKENESS